MKNKNLNKIYSKNFNKKDPDWKLQTEWVSGGLWCGFLYTVLSHNYSHLSPAARMPSFDV